MELRALNPSKTLRVSEQARFEELYSAKYPGQCHIEVLDNWNPAGISEQAFITDGEQTWTDPVAGIAFACCDSRHVWLSIDPVRIPYAGGFSAFGMKSAPFRYLRLPRRPGIYHVYVQTERVFRAGESTRIWDRKGALVTSDNILTFTVVANDPKWDAAELSKVLAVLDSKSASADEKERACTHFNLDLMSDDAIREKLRRLRDNDQCVSLSGLIDADNPKLAYDGYAAIIAEPDRPMKDFPGPLPSLRVRVMNPSLHSDDFARIVFDMGQRQALAENFQAATRQVAIDLKNICEHKRKDLKAECVQNLELLD